MIADWRYCFILVGHLLELRINSIIVSATQNWRQHADAAFLAANRSSTMLLIEILPICANKADSVATKQ